MDAPVVVLGGILTGIVTVTEAAAVAVVCALLVGLFINRELSLKELPQMIIHSQVAAGGMLFIIADGEGLRLAGGDAAGRDGAEHLRQLAVAAATFLPLSG